MRLDELTKKGWKIEKRRGPRTELPRENRPKPKEAVG